MSLSRRSIIPILAVLTLVLLIYGCCTAARMHADGAGSKMRSAGEGPKFGDSDDVIVKVHFNPDNSVTARPESARLNARRRGGHGDAGSIVWIADDKSVELRVEVVPEKAGNGQQVDCVERQPECSGRTCITNSNANYHGDDGQESATCKTLIWKTGMTKPTDPVIIVDNCCN